MALKWFCCRSETRKISQIPDWSENAIAGEHLWMPTSISGDLCNVGDGECTVSNDYSFFGVLVIVLFCVNYTHRKIFGFCGDSVSITVISVALLRVVVLCVCVCECAMKRNLIKRWNFIQFVCVQNERMNTTPLTT